MERNDDNESGRPGRSGKLSPDALGAAETVPGSSLPDESALDEIRRCMARLRKAERAFRKYLRFVDAPIPSDEAGYAFHASAAYPLLSVLKDHMQRVQELVAGTELLMAEARFIARAVRLVAAAELAQHDAIARLRNDILERCNKAGEEVGGIVRRVGEAVAPGIDVEGDAGLWGRGAT